MWRPKTMPFRARTTILALTLLCLFAGLACQSPQTGQGQDPASPEPSVRLGHGSFTSSDGIPIAFSERGEGETALVFIHGWSCDRSFWREQIQVFAQDYAVLTVDLPGHGASGIDRPEWSLPRFGRDVAEIVGDLAFEKVILIGHSMGGPVALEAARLLPNITAGVIGVDALHDLGQKIPPEAWEAFMAPYDEDFVTACGDFVSNMFRPDTETTLVTRVRDEMCDAPPEVAKALLRTFGAYDQAAAASFVSAPLRSLNADLFPTNSDGNREVAPEYEARILEGTGHFLMLEKPEAFNRLLAEMVRDLEERWIVAG